MGAAISKESRLQSPSRQESKAEVTDRVARAIIDAEAARHASKTEKLRRARLARLAKLPEQATKRRHNASSGS